MVSRKIAESLLAQATGGGGDNKPDEIFLTDNGVEYAVWRKNQHIEDSSKSSVGFYSLDTDERIL